MLPPLLELSAVVKDHGGLRPLRIRQLRLRPGETVALGGLDLAAAEVFTNLATGATLPDEGEIRVSGQATSAIADHDAWLAFLDQFGVVSDRVVLLDAFTVRQNVAMPFTLELQPMAADVADRAARLADEVGIEPAHLDVPVGALGGPVKQRVRLARAVAHAPKLLILEHPTAGLDASAVPAFAGQLAAVLGRRALAAVVVTADTRFARALGARILVLKPATGEVREAGGWKLWR